jgi:TPR repeat protein
MSKSKITNWFLALVIAATALPSLSQQDEGPILRPRVQPAKPAGATLLVICDIACNWKLDSEPKGRIEAGHSAKVNVVLGQHLVVAVTQDGLDKAENQIEVKAVGQTIARLELQPVRDARLKSDQAEKAAQDESARLQELSDHAGERLKSGESLYDQKRYEEAWAMLRKACEGGEMVGCYDLGAAYYIGGHGVGQDYAQARSFYQKACDGGHMDGCCMLGTLYQNSQGVTLDYAQARTFYQKACNGGQMDGCSQLGTLYESGQGVAQDYAQARTFYQKACNGGQMDGCFSLGALYDHGHGETQDFVQARRLFQKACEGGNMYGCYGLGHLYLYGQGIEKDTEKAKQLFNKACSMGEQTACDVLKEKQ